MYEHPRKNTLTIKAMSSLRITRNALNLSGSGFISIKAEKLAAKIHALAIMK